jgi:hypothetical protein
VGEVLHWPEFSEVGEFGRIQENCLISQRIFSFFSYLNIPTYSTDRDLSENAIKMMTLTIYKIIIFCPPPPTTNSTWRMIDRGFLIGAI